MTDSVVVRRSVRSVAFDGAVVVSGGLAFVVAAAHALGSLPVSLTAAAVPLTALMARYPVVLARAGGDIEIGFDSAMLVVLALLVPTGPAVTIWGLGVLLAQLTLRKSWSSRVFNVGLGLLIGWLALAVMHLFGPLDRTQPRVLLAVGVGAATYFVADYLLTGASLAIETSSWRGAVSHDVSVPVSAAIFIGVDSLGFVAAMLARSSPWSLPLLATPLVTLLYAARAYKQANDNRATMTAMFDAARDAHHATTPREILATLLDNTRSMLRAPSATLRRAEPGPAEIGFLLPDTGEGPMWLVAPRQPHAPVRAQRMLDMLGALAIESLSRALLVGEMAHLARHDPLTGLPNRALFVDRVQHGVALSERSPRLLAVLFIDLDGFKGVNDSLGHDAGDQLLIAVAQRLGTCVRPSDTVGRLGGDEFAVLLEDMKTADGATEVAERILTALREPTRVAGVDVAIGASIGIAVRSDGDDAGTLLRHSDLAMYRAKESGRGRYHLFTSRLWAESRERLALEGDLRRVLERAELALTYQPVINLDTGTIEGFEALLRWDHPGHGRLEPLRFVGIAEETGLIGAIGQWVLETAYADAVAWTRRYRRPLTMAVNLSPQQLGDQRIVEQVASLLTRNDAPVQLVLEITESTFVHENSDQLRRMRELHDLGVQLAIDDFGTGYSSIGYLRHMPIDILKIDRSFVADIARDSRSASLVEAITVMARSLDLTLIAEGIEEPEQVVALHAMGCSLGQGYWFARPLSGDDAQAMLSRRRLGRPQVPTARLARPGARPRG
jgi:diguanylate cyclase (GGDEF)-like protein